MPDDLEKVWIHISDVSRWVRPASALCSEAERRMTSAYFADGVISMFPPVLSERLLSLGAKAESYALSCGVVLSDKGDIVSYEICPSLIRLSHRITYTTLDSILNGQTPADTLSDVGSAKDLIKLNEWTRLRGAYRKDENFALDSYLMHKTELSLSVDTIAAQGSEQKTVITTVLKHGDSLSVNLVAECMILMSESVGDLCGDIGAAVTYKTQRPQSPFHASDLEALKGETPYMRSIRIVRYLKGAMDSRTKGV